MIDIEELKRLEAVATEGHWELHTSNECYTTEIVQVGYDSQGCAELSQDRTFIFHSDRSFDADLIAKLRNSAKELLALAEWAIEAKEMLDFYADFLERHNFGCKENVFELREIVSNYPQFPKDGEK